MLPRRLKKMLLIAICFLFSSFMFSAGAVEVAENSGQRYSEIVETIKDNPRQAIKDLKKIADTNHFAAMEYLILLSIYEPQKVNTPEFEQIAERLHNLVTAQYAEIVAERSFYQKYHDGYEELTADGYLKCYKDLSCLIKAGAYNFSKFFNIWEEISPNIRYVPWGIVVPCETAQKLHLTAIMDGAYGGHGAETMDISDCNKYPQYNFPKDVEEYYTYIQQELRMESVGSIRFAYMAWDVYQNILNHYDPDWNFEHTRFSRGYSPEYLQARPLEAWAMESYPNYRYFQKIINHGIGFDRAVEKLTKHYVKAFRVDKDTARRYAHYAMTPWAAKSFPIDKETLRYKILSGVPTPKIKTWLADKKSKGEKFAEPEMPHPADDILMIAVHRPDVLKILIDSCSGNGEKSSCSGLNTDINGKNTFGKTALMYAAQYGFTESVKILLAAGADINAQTDEGNQKDSSCADDPCIANGSRTALMYAVQEGHLETAKYLVKNGADINLQDSMGMTAYDYLSGKAPYWGNFRPSPTKDVVLTRPEKPENKNVTPSRIKEFSEFLRKHRNRAD